MLRIVVNEAASIINLGEYKMSHYAKVDLQQELKQCLPSCERNIVNPFKNLFQILKLWNERIEERKQLAKVDQRLLKDMGISMYEAQQEIAKPFWRN